VVLSAIPCQRYKVWTLSNTVQRAYLWCWSGTVTTCSTYSDCTNASQCAASHTSTSTAGITRSTTAGFNISSAETIEHVHSTTACDRRTSVYADLTQKSSTCNGYVACHTCKRPGCYRVVPVPYWTAVCAHAAHGHSLSAPESHDTCTHHSSAQKAALTLLLSTVVLMATLFAACSSWCAQCRA
jgi:hypothetical protein